MNTKSPKIYKITAVLVAILAACAIVDILYVPVIKPLWVVSCPFLIAIAFAFLLSPIIEYLEEKKFSRTMGVITVSLVFIIIFTLIVTLIIPKAIDQSLELAQSFIKDDTLYTKISSTINSSQHILKQFKAEDLSATITDAIKASSSKIAGYIGNVLVDFLGKISWIIIIPLTTIWLLKDFNYIGAKAKCFIPKQYRSKMTYIICEVGSVFAKYFRGLIVVGLFFGIITTIVFTLFGIKFAIILGIASSILYLIPYIGLFFIIVAMLICTMLQSLSLGSIIALVCILIVLNAIFDMVITPNIAGGAVGVHPILSLFALMLGGQFMGVLGMIIAVPLAASCQIILASFFPQIRDTINMKDGRYILPNNTKKE